MPKRSQMRRREKSISFRLRALSRRASVAFLPLFSANQLFKNFNSLAISSVWKRIPHQVPFVVCMRRTKRAGDLFKFSLRLCFSLFSLLCRSAGCMTVCVYPARDNMEKRKVGRASLKSDVLERYRRIKDAKNDSLGYLLWKVFFSSILVVSLFFLFDSMAHGANQSSGVGGLGMRINREKVFASSYSRVSVFNEINIDKTWESQLPAAEKTFFFTMGGPAARYQK